MGCVAGSLTAKGLDSMLCGAKTNRGYWLELLLSSSAFLLLRTQMSCSHKSTD